MGGRLSLPDVQSLFAGDSYQVVVLGLDDAGKSTVLYQLKHAHFVHTSATVGFNYETVS